MRFDFITAILLGLSAVGLAMPSSGAAAAVQNVQLGERGLGDAFAAIVKGASKSKGKVLPDTTKWVKDNKRPAGDDFTFPDTKKPNIATLKRPGATIENWKAKIPKIGERAVEFIA